MRPPKLKPTAKLSPTLAKLSRTLLKRLKLLKKILVVKEASVTNWYDGTYSPTTFIHQPY